MAAMMLYSKLVRASGGGDSVGAVAIDAAGADALRLACARVDAWYRCRFGVDSAGHATGAPGDGTREGGLARSGGDVNAAAPRVAETFAFSQYVQWRRAAYLHTMRRMIERAGAARAPPAASVVAAVVHRAALLMDATVGRHLVDDYGDADADGGKGTGRPRVDGRVCGFKLGTWAAACFWVAQKVEFSDMDDDFGVADIEHHMNAYDGIVAAESALLALLNWEVIVPTTVDIGVLLFERRAGASLEEPRGGGGPCGDDESRLQWAHHRQDAVEACAQLLLDAVPLTPPMFSSAAVAAVAFAAATVGQAPGIVLPSTPPPTGDPRDSVDAANGADGVWYSDSDAIAVPTAFTVSGGNKRVRVM